MSDLLKTMRTSWLAALLVLACFPITGHAALDEPWRDISALYVFGDSLMDSGNVFAATGNTSTAPYSPIPGAPYDIGGNRFTNGKSWVEFLAHDMHQAKGGRAALDNPEFGNFAFGGARASGGANVPDFTTQVGLFLQTNNFVVDPNALYVIGFGGNDVRHALSEAAAGRDPMPVIVSAVDAMFDNIQLLIDLGARKLMIANVADLGKVPFVPDPFRDFVTDLSNGLNQALEQKLATITTPGVEIYRIDLFSFLNAAVSMPTAFGFQEAHIPCLTFGVTEDAICDEPTKHLFWDGIHPTRAGHHAISNIAKNVLSISAE